MEPDYDKLEWREHAVCPDCGLPRTKKYFNVFMCGSETDSEGNTRKQTALCKAVSARIAQLVADNTAMGRLLRDSIHSGCYNVALQECGFPTCVESKAELLGVDLTDILSRVELATEPDS